MRELTSIELQAVSGGAQALRRPVSLVALLIREENLFLRIINRLTQATQPMPQRAVARRAVA